VRDCASCAAFAASVDARTSDLRALVPVLPAAASAAVLSRAMHAAGQTAVGGAGGGGGAAAAGAAGKTIGVAFTTKGFATASVLAAAAVSVGGVAAVVRIAPDLGRLGGSHRGPAARVRAVSHARAAATGGSVGHLSMALPGGPARHAGSGSRFRGGASGVGAVGTHTPTGAAGRHVSFVRSHHGQGLAERWHRATFAAHASHGASVPGQHGHRGGGLQQGSSAARHDPAAAPRFGHRAPVVNSSARGHGAGFRANKIERGHESAGAAKAGGRGGAGHGPAHGAVRGHKK
jgi:hypothetical protein